jgi:hypothetical protein
MAAKQTKQLKREGEPAHEPEGTLYQPGQSGRKHGRHESSSDEGKRRRSDKQR